MTAATMEGKYYEILSSLCWEKVTVSLDLSNMQKCHSIIREKTDIFKQAESELNKSSEKEILKDIL